MSLLDSINFAANPEPRCPVILLLDTSDSMSGHPIQELNEGIAVFKKNIEDDDTAKKRVEIAVIIFGGEPAIIHPFSTIEKFTLTQLTSQGMTPMGRAIELALDELEKRKNDYKKNGIAYYQPWLFLITDGQPSDYNTDHWSNAVTKVRKATAESKLSFYAVAVKDANMEILKEIAPSDTPPLPLDGLKFKELFKWLSDSLRETSRLDIGEEVTLADLTSWIKKQA